VRVVPEDVWTVASTVLRKAGKMAEKDGLKAVWSVGKLVCVVVELKDFSTADETAVKLAILLVERKGI
jgi:hypothetical protein